MQLCVYICMGEETQGSYFAKGAVREGCDLYFLAPHFLNLVEIMIV